MTFFWILACGREEVASGGECSPFYYENFGAGFMTEHCQGCHAEGAADREGAPVEITFDNVASILEHREIIIYEIEEQTMPPVGGIPQEERSAAVEWMTCLENP